MAVDHRRLLNFDPAVKELHDYFTDFQNKEAIIQIVQNIKSGIWGYFLWTAHKYYSDFEIILNKTNDGNLILSAIVDFYNKDLNSGMTFLAEAILRLFPNDNKYVKELDILEKVCSIFISQATATVKRYMAEQKKMAAETLFLEKKKKEDEKERNQMLSNGNFKQRWTTATNDHGEETNSKKNVIPRNKLEDSTELSAAKNLIGSLFEAKFPGKKDDDRTKEEKKIENNIRWNIFLNKHKDEVGKKKKAVAKSKASLAIQSFLTNRLKQNEQIKQNEKQVNEISTSCKFDLDPFHRKPMR